MRRVKKFDDDSKMTSSVFARDLDLSTPDKSRQEQLSLSSPGSTLSLYTNITKYHKMSSARLVLRSFRAAPRVVRPFSSVAVRFAEHESRIHDNIDVYRRHQMEKPLNPHLTNTTSTIVNEMPSIGKDNAPPELITNVDPEFVAKDSVPENTERMTGGTQTGNPESGVNADLKVGELEESAFRVEPLRRTGEDTNTTRARLLCSLPITFNPV
jgi:hypothetical protein